MPLIARLSDSVAPLVKKISSGCAPINVATWSRALSTASSAAHPQAWLRLEGSPNWSVKYGIMASSTSRSMGVVVDDPCRWAVSYHVIPPAAALAQTRVGVFHVVSADLLPQLVQLTLQLTDFVSQIIDRLASGSGRS